MNNCYKNCNCKDDMEDNDAIEKACQNVDYCDNDYDDDDCECGFDSEKDIFPTNPMLGQSYVPIQHMNKTFTPCCGLKNGTIFPELVNPYYPGQSMMEIDYLKMRNEVGEGCNKCS